MKRLKSFFAVAILSAATFISFSPALPAGAQSSASLSIVPRKNYEIQPGKSVKDTLVIRNLDNTQSLDLNLRVIDFSYTDTTGTPKLFLDTNIAQTTWSLKPYLTVPETVSIPAGGSKSLDIGVAIPANVGAGSYYSAILYASGAAQTGGNVGLSASGVTLVFTQVPGQVSENLALKQLGAYNQSSTETVGTFNFINYTKPKQIGYTLKNSGNVTESPAGSLTLTNMWGQKQVINNINPNSSLALIGQSRTFTTCLKSQTQTVNLDGTSNPATTCQTPDLWPGVYHVKLDAFYGQNGNQTKEIVGDANFIYAPWWALLILFVLIVLLLILILWIIRKVRQLTGKAPKKSKK